MYTPDALLKIATTAEAVYEARSVLFPAGTYDKLRNDARRLMERAIDVAAAMEAHKMEPKQFVGPFGTMCVKKGDRVRIRKGAQLRTTHPSYPEGKIAGATYVVTVHHTFDGYMLDPHTVRKLGISPIVNPKVCWAGTGGYWVEADINDVEILPQG